MEMPMCIQFQQPLIKCTDLSIKLHLMPVIKVFVVKSSQLIYIAQISQIGLRDLIIYTAYNTLCNLILESGVETITGDTTGEMYRVTVYYCVDHQNKNIDCKHAYTVNVANHT